MMTRLNDLQRILVRLQRASRNVQYKFPLDKFVPPKATKEATMDELSKEELIKKINSHIDFLENREYSYMVYKREK